MLFDVSRLKIGETHMEIAHLVENVSSEELTAVVEKAFKFKNTCGVLIERKLSNRINLDGGE